MANEVAVARTPWRVKDVKEAALGRHGLATMADTGEIDLRNIVRILRRRKLLLVITVLVTLSGSIWWMSRATPRYTADVLIVIESRPSSIVKVDEAVQDVNADNAKVNTEVAVLKSRGLAARVIDKLKLAKDPEFQLEVHPSEGFRPWFSPRVLAATIPDLMDHTLSLLIDPEVAGGDLTEAQNIEGNSTPDSARVDQEPAAVRPAAIEMREAQGAGGNPMPDSARVDQELTALRSAAVEMTKARAIERAALLDRFFSHLSVEPEGNSRLIRISFTSTDAGKAAYIANELVDEYIESQLETKSEGARRAAGWLEVRLDELGDTVQTLERSVQEQRTNSGSDGIKIVEQRLTQLNGELVVAQAKLTASKARYQQAQGVLKGGGDLQALPSVIASGSVQALRGRIVALQEKLSELRTSYGENHPTVVSVRAEMAEVEHSLERDIDNILSGLDNEVVGAAIHETKLRAQLDELNEEMVRLNTAETAIGQVAQRLSANRDLYENLLKRQTEAVALRDNQQPDARIISPAQIPLRPSYPNLPRVMALSLLASVSFAVVLLVVAERLRRKLDSVEDVERQVGLQVIGAIPDLSRVRRLTSAPGDYVQREPLSEFGGAFQRLRALLTLGNDRRMPRTVLVTSGMAGEGKTTIAVCLGIGCVSSGQKVILVDCDFSRPQVHRMLDVKNESGLTDVLKGNATLEESVKHPTGHRLSILTIGRSRQGAIDLLNSERMEGLLTELRKVYDVIILDSAPVLEVSNALILGGLAERTILVTRRAWTTWRDAAYAAKQLHLYGSEIAGVVFNRAGAV
jgi:polysaccharide biosynthesis transport protein